MKLFWRRPKPPPPINYAEYYGTWVAIREHRVIAKATSALGILDKVRAMGEDGGKSSIRYVEPPETTVRWGVTTPPSIRIMPNCKFHHRDEAEAWARSSWSGGPHVLWEFVGENNITGEWQEVGPIE